MAMRYVVVHISSHPLLAPRCNRYCQTIDRDRPGLIGVRGRAKRAEMLDLLPLAVVVENYERVCEPVLAYGGPRRPNLAEVKLGRIVQDPELILLAVRKGWIKP